MLYNANGNHIANIVRICQLSQTKYLEFWNREIERKKIKKGVSRGKEEQRRNEERDIQRIGKNPKKYLKRIKKLTEEKESHKCKNNHPPQEINIFFKFIVLFLFLYFLHAQFISNSKYDKDEDEDNDKNKFHTVSNMPEAKRKEFRETDTLEKKVVAQSEVSASQNYSVCEETRMADGSIKEKFEYRQNQSNIINMLTNREVTLKQSCKVENLYRYGKDINYVIFDPKFI